ncbi:MAG: UDP-3-O-(3-hydroxymyristoyl)glucosamine N-acyltransferase [Bacteroidota bacterium]|jgi:UDP-3-O-[3-hydroxymyristoyl] glucosamine N-acyltransferase
MKFSAKQIAELLNGVLDGDESVSVSGICKIEEGKPGFLTFLANPKYTPFIYETDASIVIVNKSFTAENPIKTSCTLIRVEDAYGSFATLMEFYNQFVSNKSGIEQPSFISDSANLGVDCYVGAFVYIGKNVKIGNRVKIYPQCYIGDNSSIGDDTVLFSGVKVYHDCHLGKSCTIHANTVIGSDGFGFAPNAENNYKKVPQIGNVIIEDYVEIGSNTSVDRATMGSTIIRKGAKLDNLIQIAHNVEVGENTVLAGGVFIAGSSKVGKNVMIGGQAGVVGHIRIADGVKIAGQSGVQSSVEREGEILQGSPAFSIGEYKRCYIHFRNLNKFYDRLGLLEKEVKKLSAPADD